METAFRGSYIIGVGANVFRVRVIELKSDFDFGLFLNAFYVNRLWMQNFFILVLVGDKGSDARLHIET